MFNVSGTTPSDRPDSESNLTNQQLQRQIRRIKLRIRLKFWVFVLKFGIPVSVLGAFLGVQTLPVEFIISNPYGPGTVRISLGKVITGGIIPFLAYRGISFPGSREMRDIFYEYAGNECRPGDEDRRVSSGETSDGDDTEGESISNGGRADG